MATISWLRHIGVVLPTSVVLVVSCFVGVRLLSLWRYYHPSLPPKPFRSLPHPFRNLERIEIFFAYSSKQGISKKLSAFDISTTHTSPSTKNHLIKPINDSRTETITCHSVLPASLYIESTRENGLEEALKHHGMAGVVVKDSCEPGTLYLVDEDDMRMFKSWLRLEVYVFAVYPAGTEGAKLTVGGEDLNGIVKEHWSLNGVENGAVHDENGVLVPKATPIKKRVRFRLRQSD